MKNLKHEVQVHTSNAHTNISMMVLLFSSMAFLSVKFHSLTVF